MEKIKSFRLKVLLSFLLGFMVFVAGALFTATGTAKADNEEGDRYFRSTNGVVNYLPGTAGTAGGNAGMRTTVTDITEDSITLTLNQAIKGVNSTFFAFDKYVNADEEVVAIADMIVLTLTSVNNPNYQISLINYYDGTYGWGRSVVALTDDVEYRYDEASQFYRVYIKGTDQQVVGLDTTYKASGTLSQSKEYGDGSAIFGASYYYFCLDTSGNVFHNNSKIFANVCAEDYFTASTANLDVDNPYYARYNQDYVNAVISELNKNGQTMLTISYVGLHLDETVSDTVGFNISQINGSWLPNNGNVIPMSYPFVMSKVENLYTGESYTVRDVIEIYSSYRVNGVVTAAIEGWTSTVVQDGTTWFNNSTAGTKTFTPTEVGEYGITVYTRCAPTGQSWSDRYLKQDVFFTVKDGTPTVEAIENFNGLVTGNEYDILDLFKVWYLGDNPVITAYFDGNAVTDTKFTADGKDHELKLSVVDSKSRAAEFSFTATHAHEFGEWVDKIEPDCDSDGVLGHYYCSICEKYFDADGKYICDNENDLIIYTDGHDYGEWIDEIEPDCENDGVKGHYHCSICEKDFDAEFHELDDLTIYTDGHDFSEWIDEVATTCETDGVKGHYHCSICNKDYDAEFHEIADVTIQTEGHQYGEWIDEVATTCETDGVKGHYHCSVCEKDFDAEYNELDDLTVYTDGHDFGEWIDEVATTCEADGVKGHYHCSICGKDYDEEFHEIADITIQTDGHDYGEWVDEIPATADAEGVKGHYHCSICEKDFNADYEELDDLTIPAGVHDYGEWINEVPATCEADGVKGHYHCSICNKDYDAEYNELDDLTIHSNGHDYGEWIDEIPATEDATGVKGHYHCSICEKDFDKNHKELKSLVIPKVRKNTGCMASINAIPFTALIALIVSLSIIIIKVSKKKERN